MPFGVSAATAAGLAASAISAASSIYGMVNAGGGGQGSTVPGVFQPPNQAGQAGRFQAGVNAMFPYALSIPGQVIPGLEGATSALTSNPYVPLAQASANTAGAYGLGTLAPNQAAGSSALFGLGGMGAGAAPQILSTGFDPQQALYNRTQQQIIDQSNAINSMYGLGSSPAGAGLTQKAIENFNIDWQNQQLARQAQAAQAFGNLSTGAGRDFAGGTDLGAAAMGTFQTAGGIPYGTFQQQQQDKISALNALSSGAAGAFGLDQNTLNAIAAYLKLGQSATAIGQTGAMDVFNQGQTLGKNLGSAITGLGQLFGPSANQPVTDPGAQFGGTVGSFPSVYGNMGVYGVPATDTLSGL